MKKCIIFFLIISLLGTINVHAEFFSSNEIKKQLIELNIIDENYFVSSDTITRGECLIAIMRTIGLTDESIKKMGGTSFETFVDCGTYSYYGIAHMENIAFGVYCDVDFPTYRTSHTGRNKDFFFFRDRVVTTREALLFMVRCLQKTPFQIPIVMDQYARIVEIAEEKGLVTQGDKWLDNIDSALSYDAFYVLMNRLLHQKRYKYFFVNREMLNRGIDKEQSVSYIEVLACRIDEERSVSYIEMLQTTQ